MKKQISFLMLGIAAMLASCNQDEVLQGMDNSGGVQTVTLTASMGDMKTRAVSYDSDDDITQCRLELWQDNARVGNSIVGEVSEDKRTCTFTFSAKQGAYDVLIWVSDGSYTVDDLSNVTVISGGKPGIAYYTKISVTEIKQGLTAELTHAVAKVTLRTTTSLLANATVTVTVPTYSAFNVNEEKVTGEVENMNFEPAEVTAELPNGGEVFSFYVLAPVAQSMVAENVTIVYNEETTAVTNVPLRANYRTVLSGDLAKLANGSLAATIDTDWGGNEYSGYSEAVAGDGEITTYGNNQITADLINQAMANGAELTINGPLGATDITNIKTWLDTKATEDATTKYTLNLNDIEEIPSDAFNGCINVSIIKMPKASKIGNGAFKNMSSPTLYLIYDGDMEVGDCFDETTAYASQDAGKYSIYISSNQQNGTSSPGLTPKGFIDSYVMYTWGNAEVWNSWIK